MADPLSITASVVAVIQLTSSVVRCLIDIKDCSRDCSDLLMELSLTNGTLSTLRDTLEAAGNNPQWHSTMSIMALPNGPISQLRVTLERLRAKIEPLSGLKRTGRALMWPFKRQEVREILSSIERQKTLFILAFQNDNQMLSLRISSDVVDVKTTLRQLEQISMDENSTKILEWMSPLVPQRKHNNVRSRRLEGSGEWLLRMDVYNAWLDDPNSPKILWCPGKPGAGKTILASLVIDVLIEDKLKKPELAFFYYDFSESEAQTHLNVVGSLLRQFLTQQPHLPTNIKELYDQLSKTGQSPPVDELTDALEGLCKDDRPRFIVIDALDECKAGKPREAALNLIRHLEKLGVRFFITSRPHADGIKKAFDSFAQIIIEADYSDIAKYIEHTIEADEEIAELVDKELKQEIVTELCMSAHGMFLLPALQIQNIIQQPTKTQVRQALREKPLDLDVAFQNTLERIENQPVSKHRLAMRALLWISHAYRPLSKDELCEALAIQPGHAQLDRDNLPLAKHLVEYCSGLILIDDQGETFRLMHLSLQEHLQANREKVFPFGQQDITSTCLTYLDFEGVRKLGSQYFQYRVLTKFTSSRAFSRTFEGDGDSGKRKYCLDAYSKDPLKFFPLLQYAILHWFRHAQSVPLDSYKNLALKILDSKPDIEGFIAIFNIFYKPEKRVGNFRFVSRLDEGSSALHLTAFLGLEALTELLLNRSHATINAEDDDGNNPLSLAAINNQVNVVKTLLDKGPVIKEESSVAGNWSYMETALYGAAVNEHAAIVDLLIEHGANVNAANQIGDTPLMVASRGGSSTTMRILLNAGASVDATDKYGHNVLDYAMMWEEKAAVKILQEHGATASKAHPGDQGAKITSAVPKPEGKNDERSVG